MLFDGLDGLDTSASNLGVGDADGKVAAQTQSSMQKAAMYLSRRGLITWMAQTMRSGFCHELNPPLCKLRGGG